MRRRDFITLFGGVAAWPFAVRAQQSMPMIGWLGSETRESEDFRVVPFRQGLKEASYSEGENLAIEYRFAEGQYDRLPALAADLVRRQVIAIALTGAPAALAAKAATTTIPIIFEVADDPVRLGLVASLNRPGGNLTGLTSLNVEVAPKQWALLHEVIPAATIIALLVNPDSPTRTKSTTRDAQVATRRLGLRLHVLHATSERDFDKVFATFAQLQAGALVIGPGGRLHTGVNHNPNFIRCACRHRRLSLAAKTLTLAAIVKCRRAEAIAKKSETSPRSAAG